MSRLDHLFENNRGWAQRVKTDDPDFFDLLPGEIFVHRNVANMVVHTDFNCLSVLAYAIDVLRVRHVMVVGHYGCGGIRAAYEDADNGLIDNWLRNIKDVQFRHRARIDALADDEARRDLLCELNVTAQVAHVCHTTIAQNAWSRGQPLAVHGWIYSLRDGLLKDLDCTVDSLAQIPDTYRVKS